MQVTHDEALLYLFGVIATVGFVAAPFFAWCYSRFITNILLGIGERTVKWTIEIIQFLAGITGVFAGYSTLENKPQWLAPSVAAITCVFAWKLAQIAIDSRLKSEGDRAKDVSEMLYRLILGLGYAITAKLKRV